MDKLALLIGFLRFKFSASLTPVRGTNVTRNFLGIRFDQESLKNTRVSQIRNGSRPKHRTAIG